MFEHTDLKRTPWFVVNADKKKPDVNVEEEIQRRVVAALAQASQQIAREHAQLCRYRPLLPHQD